MSVRVPALEVAVRTDPGRDPEKQVNEDSSVEQATPLGHLVVVCDGMGGHAGGAEASRLAIRGILEGIAEAPAGATPGEALAWAIRAANRRVFFMTTPVEIGGSGGRPGSTVVAALIHDGGTEIAHVGDSRAYLLHAGQVSPLTKDHSAVQRMVDDGLLTPAEAARHPEANRILRALGIGAEVEVELRIPPVAYAAGDVIVLCSDGLSDLVLPEDLLVVADSVPVAQSAGQLVDLANARGGHDNITVAVVRLQEGVTRPREPLPPTVTQTMEQVPAPVLLAAPPPVVLPAPPVVVPPAPPPREPAVTLVPSRARRAALVGIVVAFVGLVAVSLAAVQHHRERGGRRKARLVEVPIVVTPTPSAVLAPSEPGVAAPEVEAGGEPLLELQLPDAGHRGRLPPP